mgnify:CR=1 FL=1
MKHFGWTEDDILYEDHEQDWYEDDDYDESTKSNGESEWGDAQSWEEWEEDWLGLIEEHDSEVDF